LSKIHHQSFDYMHNGRGETLKSAIFRTFGRPWPWPWIRL